MALKICKECGSEVSSTGRCPKCGKDQRNFFIKHKVITFILVIFIITIIFVISEINKNNDANQNYNNESENEINYSKYKTTYQWECTKDIQHEQISENQILAIENDNYNGIVLESGKYKISYIYKDFTSTFGLTTTNKYNRFYFVYIADELGTIQDIMNEKIRYNYWFTFCPEVHDEQIVNVDKGQYIYIEHTPIKEAGYGTIKLEKI